MVDILLKAFAAIARGQSAASGTGEQTSFEALSLGVSGPSDFLNDNAPFSLNIHCASRTTVNDIAWADVPFFTRPVSLFEEFAVVIGVVKMFFGQGSQSIN